MKILTIIGCSNRLGVRDANLERLVEAVIEARSAAFMYFKHHRRQGSQLVPCSETLIRERIRLCGELQLLNTDTWTLTRYGQQALHVTKFDAVITGQVTNYLSEKGFDVSQIQRRISGSSGPVWLPTATALYEREEPGLTIAEFRRLLGLLAESGYFRVVQSRIYLPAK
jgi:hypothetical protein